MKHATSTALDALEPLLAQLRGVAGLREKKRGVFYRGSAACLHFHEDPAGFFADLRTGPTWTRYEVTTAQQRRTLLREARHWAAASGSSAR